MTKTLLILATFFSFSAAYADYFSCVIKSQNGLVRAAEEAEYRVLQVSVSDGEFICEGRINSKAMTEVRMRSLITGDSRGSSSLGSSHQVDLTTYNIVENNLQTVICKCGMN